MGMYSKQEIAKGFKEASGGESGGWYSDPIVKAVKGLMGSNESEASDQDVQKQAIKSRLKQLSGDDE